MTLLKRSKIFKLIKDSNDYSVELEEMNKQFFTTIFKCTYSHNKIKKNMIFHTLIASYYQ